MRSFFFFNFSTKVGYSSFTFMQSSHIKSKRASEGFAKFVREMIVQGDSCPWDFCPKTELSKETIFRCDFCPRKVLPVKSFAQIILFSSDNLGLLSLGQKSPWTIGLFNNFLLDIYCNTAFEVLKSKLFN